STGLRPRTACPATRELDQTLSMPPLVDPLDSGEDTDSWPGPAYQHVAKAPKKRPGPKTRARKPPAKRPRRLIDAALEMSVRRKETDRMVQTMKRLLIEGSELAESAKEDAHDEDNLVATFIHLQAKRPASETLETEDDSSDDTAQAPSTCKSQCIFSADHHHLVNSEDLAATFIQLQAKSTASGMLATEHHSSEDTVQVPSTCESQGIFSSADQQHLVTAADGKDEKIKLLERMVAAANSRFDDKNAECEQLKIERQVNKDEVQQWKDRFNDQKSVIRGLEIAKETFGRREKQLIDQRDELVGRVSLRDFIRRSMLRRIHDQSRRAEQWRQRATTSNNENVILSAQVTNLQADLSTKTKDLQSAHATLQDQSKRVSQLQQEATTAAKANTTLSLQIRALLGDLEVKTRDLRSTQGVLDESASKIQELEEANSIAQRSLETCQSQTVGLQDQHQAQFNATGSRLQDVISRAKTRYTILSKKLFEANLEIRTRDTQIQKLTEDAKNVQQTMLSNDTRFRQSLDQYKQRLKKAEKRANELDRTVQEDRRSWMQEIKVLVGVEDGDHRKLLDCLGIPHTSWRCTIQGHHQGCLNIQSSMLQGRRPLQLRARFRDIGDGPTSAEDINLQLIKVSLGTESVKTGQSTSLLWDLWALLEGAMIHSNCVEQIACAAASVTKHLFQLFSQGNITDLEFWIAAQIFCTLLPWGFAELDLDNILLPTLSCHQINRPLVTAAFSRIYVSRTSLELTKGTVHQFRDLCQRVSRSVQMFSRLDGWKPATSGIVGIA
ncbi:MAG: hypothetical protein Q9196_003565, partial [Gyalolechia fulgens]